MKQTVEIEVPDGKKAIWKDNKIIFEDIKPKLPKTWEEFCKQNNINKEEVTMNKNVDLTKILENCPKGTKFYSSIYGDLLYSCMHLRLAVQKITFIKPNSISSVDYYRDGRYCQSQGECTIFPSRDCRDWSKFSAPWYKKEESVKPKFKVGDIIRHKEANKGNIYKISRINSDLYVIDGFAGGIYIKNQDQYELVPNKFDPKTLKPFDKVLVRDSNEIKWKIDFFSHYHESIHFPYKCIGNSYKYCIPYNDDTEYLVGTTDKAPEFYKYWKD